MNEEGDGATKQQSKKGFLSRDRWRGKRASSEPDPPPDFQLNSDVVDFLKPSAGKLRPVSPKAPRIDIAAAQRWSGNNPELQSGNAIVTPSSMRGRGTTEKKARRKGLAVKFVLTAPEIIGEGGDEAEAPAIEISRQRQGRLANKGAVQDNDIRHQTPPDLVTGQTTADGANMYPTFGQEAPINRLRKRLPSPQPPRRTDTDAHALPHQDTDFVPKPLMRVGTSWSDYNQDARPPTQDEDDEDDTSDAEAEALPQGQPDVPRSRSNLSYHLPEIKSMIENSPIEVANQRNSFLEVRPRDRNSLSAQLQHLMREGEGKALHEAFRSPIPEPADDVARQANSTNSAHTPHPSRGAPVPAFSSATSTRLITPQPRRSRSPSNRPPSKSSSRNTTPRDRSPALRSSANPTPAAQPRPAMTLRKPVPASQNTNESATAPSEYEPPPGPPPGREPIQQPQPVPRDVYPPPIARAEPPASPLPPLVIPEARSRQDQSAPQTASTLPTASSTMSTGSYTQAAYEDFCERCSHMPGIFRLQAEFESPMFSYSANEWLRCATWWFLRSRAGMEAIIRSRPRSSDGRPMSRDQPLLMQPHVDLAKASWILNEVLPTHPGLRPSSDPSYTFRAAVAREAGDLITADLLESAEVLLSNIKALISSMSRNGAMPPSNALIQGQDQTIWLRYPKISPNIVAIFSGNVARSITDSGPARQHNPLSIMAVADTKTDFCYSRAFVNATLYNEDSNAERIALPCIVSTLRPRNDWNPKVTICTQRELVSVCISGDRKIGPSWEDVRWSEEHCLLHVRLPHGYCLDAQLAEPDFKQIWNTYNHSYNVQASLMPQKDERMVFETALRDCQYKCSRQPVNFPLERVKRCRVRLFARSQSRVDGSLGQRRFYRGLRLLVVTSPKNKMLGLATHDVSILRPNIVEMGIDPTNDGAAVMKFLFGEENRQSSLYMVFNEPNDQQALYRILNDMDTGPDEAQVASVRLSSLSIQPASTLITPNADPSPLLGMKWQSVSVINSDPHSPDRDLSRTVLSDHLRAVAQAGDGTLTDRINVAPGELQLRLPVSGIPELMILRERQEDLSLTVDIARCRVLPDSLLELMRTVSMHQTVHTYSFHNALDLHAFQKSITGYTVKYDNVATSFVIARRRPTGMLSLHKRLEAGRTRVQIVSDEQPRGVTQLLAFFEDFAHADALAFQLKGVDVFEKVELKGEKGGGGRYGVRLVDAKFSLPAPLPSSPAAHSGGNKSPPKLDEGDEASARAAVAVARKFVGVDILDYPREDDDITVAFDDERERELFLAVLPAPPQASRGLTIRRRA